MVSLENIPASHIRWFLSQETDRKRDFHLPNRFYRAERAIQRAPYPRMEATVNSAMVVAYWLIGREIVEEEQQGAERAEYGKALLRQGSLHP